MSVKKSEEEEKFVLGTELRDAIAKIIVGKLPTIQYKNLVRLVDEFEIELDNLHELEVNGQ